MPGGSEPAWSPMDAVGFGWNVVTKRFSTVALPLAVGWFVPIFILYAVIFGSTFAAGALEGGGVIDRSMSDVMRFGATSVGGILWIVVMSYMLGGIAQTALKAARGQPTTFADPFSGGRYFVQFFVALIVSVVATSIGFALCIVPGVILSLGLSLQGFLIVDQNLTGVEALKRSWELTKGHRLNIFLFWIISFFVVFAGELACFFGVFLISYPLLMIAFAWIYLRIKGEHVAQPT
jgi:uncharacterized membrane protein